MEQASQALPFHPSPNLPQPMSINKIADKLRDFDLITEQTYQKVKQLIESCDISRSTLMYEIQQDAANRYIQEYFEDFSMMNVDIAIQPPETITEEMRAELLQKLNQLFESEIISGNIYERLKADILASHIKIDTDLYSKAYLELTFVESLKIKKIQRYLKRLIALDILTPDGKQKIIQDIKSENASNYIDLFKHVNRARVFDLKDYSSEPNDYFPEVSQCIIEMLRETGIAEISIDNFQVEVMKKINANGYETSVTTYSANNNGIKYEYSIPPVLKNDHSIPMAEKTEFFFLFNKILRDIASPYRLFDISVASLQLMGDLGISSDKFGFIALTENQAQPYFKNTYDYLSPKFFNEKERYLTTNTIDSIISFLEEIDLLKHLQPETITEAKQNIKQSYITQASQILTAFDNLVATTDWEPDDIEGIYRQRIQKFANASRGIFTPTNITFEWKSQTIAELALTFNERRHSTKLQFRGESLGDNKFFAFIQQIIQENYSEGKFYPVYEESYPIGYIFLNDLQKTLLEQEFNILNFG